MNLYEAEHELRQKGFSLICGVDEAGRGPLAGPVCAGAVILPPGLTPEGLNDSKKLSEHDRERLYDEIAAKAAGWSVGFASPKEIDRVNILQATYLAMRRAIGGLTALPDYVLVDGNRDPGLSLPVSLIVKGDGKVACIAAASIMAKISRDRLMRELDAQYPGYGFKKHKGYPTKEHYAAIEKLGVCPIHRLSFLKQRGAAGNE